MKPIETKYNGYRFRSRLEAKWAVFFDALGIKYLYEPEGFELRDGSYYLPDFYLPELKTWVEIKGVMRDQDFRKIKMFSSELEDDERLIVLKDIPKDGEDAFNMGHSGEGAFELYGNDNSWDEAYLPCVCPACGKVGFEFDGRGWRVCSHLEEAHEIMPSRDKDELEKVLLESEMYYTKDGIDHPMKYPKWKGHRTDDKGYTYNHPLIESAYAKARQARFEHGETPMSPEREELMKSIKKLRESKGEYKDD